MDTQNTPVQPANPNVPPEPKIKLRRGKWVWIYVGIIILLIGIRFGLFLGDSEPNKNATSSQSVTQNTTPQTNTSLAPVSSGNVSSYPTVSLSVLPLGDNKYTTTSPKKGYVYLCRVIKGNGGAQTAGSWIGTTTWTMQGKPSVEGSVSWPNATFSDKISGSMRILSGNDLPVDMTTGVFPISSSDPAYQYDRNPNSIKAQTLNLSLPVNPKVSSAPNCMGGEVGVMLNGVPLFNGFDEEMRDAAAHEIQDSCDGHPQISGEYHYHSLSRCFRDMRESTVLGFALDGFPITGPVQSNGQYLTTAALDTCHGTTSAIILDGKSTTMYHYVMTQDFPYSVSCFHGKPVSLQVIANNMQGQPGSTGSGQGSASIGQQGPGQMGGTGSGLPPQGGHGQLPPMGPPPMGQ